MIRLAGVATGLLGLLLVPLALTAGTSWLAVLGHLALTALCVGLAWFDGLAGRPATARAWGAWAAVCTAGVAGALHLSWSAHGGWAWMAPFALILLWAWVGPVAGWLAGAVGARRQAARARRAVARRLRDQAWPAPNSVG
ncbi:MAG: hypothetical protein H6732_08555 [Alphaproteobacteria bacterium]|nr:hypothetical protein [Alphaproteobacteria bacterium]